MAQRSPYLAKTAFSRWAAHRRFPGVLADMVPLSPILVLDLLTLGQQESRLLIFNQVPLNIFHPLTPSPCQLAINPQLLLYTKLSSISLTYYDSFNKAFLTRLTCPWVFSLTPPSLKVQLSQALAAHWATYWAPHTPGKWSPGLH